LLSLWSSVDGMAGEDMVIEEYIPDGWPGARSEFADYVSVESVVVDGTVTHLATNGRFALAPPFRECGFFIPSQLDAPDVEAVLETAGRAIEALDVRTGCIHTEVKLTGDGPRLLEVNGRVGGGVPFMLREATGVDILDLAIDVALGRPIAHHGLLPCTRVGYRVLVQPPPGRSRVGPVHGLDELARQPGVEGIDIHHPAGDLVDSRHGSRAYVFGVSGTATDHAGMLAVRRFIGDEVHIDYQDA
jgi:biotin carboxylase